MAYKEMKPEKLYEIYRRKHSGQKNSGIATVLNVDRKTVSKYIAGLRKEGLNFSTEIVPFKDCVTNLKNILKSNVRAKGKHSLFDKYRDEIVACVKTKSNPLKPKYAFEVVKRKYQLSCSYSSFKRYCRKHKLFEDEKGTITRIEVHPGQETQIDYGKAGMLMQPNGKKKTVYAFCGVLSSSRLPFVQFVYKQDQESFVKSNMDMWDFYGGTTNTVLVDNLKAAVIKPDIYEPELNKSYRDMAEHYGIFIDPCRVRTPTDKGKVERFVPTARQWFGMLVHLYPNSTLEDLNEKVLDLCLNEYGMKKHGTTHIEPKLAFETQEKPVLNSLPKEQFIIPKYKEAIVHPDQFVQFENKRYSLPEEYRGKKVIVKKTGKIIRIYYNSVQIKQYVIPEGVRAYDKNDFEKSKAEMMEDGYTKYLLKKARTFGNNTYKLVNQMLTPNAYINYRKVLSLFSIAEKYCYHEYYDEVIETAFRCYISHPKKIKAMLREKEQQLFFAIKPEASDLISEREKSMIFDMDYFIN